LPEPSQGTEAAAGRPWDVVEVGFSHHHFK
jgi:hypothetical protein